MNAADELDLAWRSLLPLRIRGIEYTDPGLILLGDSWALAFPGVWAWRATGSVRAESGESDAEDRVWDLCGNDIVGVRAEGPTRSCSFAFYVSDGSVLEVDSDNGWDVWVFRHDSLGVVYVGQ